MGEYTVSTFVCSQLRASGRSRRFAVSVVLLAATSGCGADESVESIDSIRAELGVGECAHVAANQVFQGKIDPPLITPQQYDTCGGGYVVDIENLAPQLTGHGSAEDARLAVQWADAPITSERPCVRSYIRALFYEWSPGSTTGTGSVTTGTLAGWLLHSDEHSWGKWVNGSCVFEEVNATGMIVGASYRIAATAQLATPTTRLTRKLSIAAYGAINFQ